MVERDKSDEEENFIDPYCDKNLVEEHLTSNEKVEQKVTMNVMCEDFVVCFG